MSDEARIRELLEQILDSEQSPEDVCSDDPELLPAVQERLKQIQAVEAELNDLFPSLEGSTRRSPARRGASGRSPRREC